MTISKMSRQRVNGMQVLFLLFLNWGIANSFSVRGTLSLDKLTSTQLYQQKQIDDNNDVGKDDSNSRRSFVVKTAAGLISSFVVMGEDMGQMVPPVLAEEELAAAVPDVSSFPICVLGANGRTGTECVQACLSRSLPVRATSRGGTYRGEKGSGLLKEMVCDVTDSKSVETAVKGTRAVIFAASASKEGGTAAQVDNLGLVTVAEACLAAKVPHLVIVSSGAVTQPNSPVYKFLNLFGNIMEEKIKGEDTVRSLYKSDTSSSVYTIIRPGGLTEEPGIGVSALELNQGDTKSGRIARADVAALCVESILNPKGSGDTTFECYDSDTGKPLQTVGISNILKQKNSAASELITGRECRGDTWEAIFSGLEKDA